MEWYEIALIVAGGLFLIFSVGSSFFGDMDLDSDVELDGGFLLSDFISFKGLLHFALGFSLTLTLWQEVTVVSVGVGVVAGLVFVGVLYYLYKMIHSKLQKSMTYAQEIKDMDAEVYFWSEEQKIGEVFVVLEGRPVTVTLQKAEGLSFTKGQKIKVSGSRQLVYPII
ncbi:MAG: hypothetical protein LBS80_01170 [Tannerella sp.]|jgi:uncharacterized membrane protein|nr:hypothetical protein [Tannerella sp.]